MQFTSEQRLDDGVLEREFTLGEIPGILWTTRSASAPVPLILVGHPGGLQMMYPRLATRARHAAAEGFAAATIELPGSGDRPRSATAEQARTDLRPALEAGERVDDEIASGWRWSSRASRPPFCLPGVSCPAPCSRRLGRSPFRCRSCCSGTKETTGNWTWTCSTPSAPLRWCPTRRYSRPLRCKSDLPPHQKTSTTQFCRQRQPMREGPRPAMVLHSPW